MAKRKLLLLLLCTLISLGTYSQRILQEKRIYLVDVTKSMEGKGVVSTPDYVSTNEGRSWEVRYIGTYCGTFQTLALNGTNVVAQTTNGFFESTNEGRSWIKRR